MATATVPSSSTSAGTARHLAAWAAIAGTVPYLVLKVLWLSGNHVGVRDPGFLTFPAAIVLNVVTAGLDLAVVALALTLTRSFSRKLPAWVVLLRPGSAPGSCCR